MAILFLLPITLRLLLLSHHPVPSPDIYDEFSHLLVADTLRHLRLANPPHALPQFFETFFVLQQPSYSSIYPLGQGLSLAIGWTLFGLPWAGVLLSTGLLCALSYWMLRGWTSPGWALLGGMLAVFQFGPLNQWTNSYWGGGYTAAAGCLVFGALPRIQNEYRLRYAALLGLGLAMHLLSRPYESILLLLSVLLFWLPQLSSRLTRPAAVAAVVCLPAIGLVLAQNREVTGKWLTLPYALSQYQYGVPASFTFQPPPVPHRQLTREQDLNYKMQKAFRNTQRETFQTYFERLIYRVRYYRFYFYPPLYVALLVFLLTMREYRFIWVALTGLIFALGVNFYPFFLPQYIGAMVCLFLLMSVEGLRKLSGIPAGKLAAQILIFLCVAGFVFSFSVHTFENRDFARALLPWEVGDAINHGNPEARIEISRRIAQIPGKLLIFVRYWPQHIFQQEWVYNAADIDGSRVVWARDLGDLEDEKLIRYFGKRTVLLLEPDARPARLIPYKPAPPAPEEKPEPERVPKMPLEPVVRSRTPGVPNLRWVKIHAAVVEAHAI